jgi:hypothetical protein
MEAKMTNQQIRNSIKLGLPFFGVTAKGEVMARYIPFGPVFKWQQNQMIPTHLEGDDLLWWLQSTDEEDQEG